LPYLTEVKAASKKEENLTKEMKRETIEINDSQKTSFVFLHVHLHLIALFKGKLMNDQHMSVSASIQVHCLPYHFTEHFPLICPSAAVAQVVFLHLS
jgi:diadenosine tetraphosphate (Ap4A) HIT family hydrolase